MAALKDPNLPTENTEVCLKCGRTPDPSLELDGPRVVLCKCGTPLPEEDLAGDFPLATA